MPAPLHFRGAAEALVLLAEHPASADRREPTGTVSIAGLSAADTQCISPGRARAVAGLAQELLAGAVTRALADVTTCPADRAVAIARRLVRLQEHRTTSSVVIAGRYLVQREGVLMARRRAEEMRAAIVAELERALADEELPPTERMNEPARAGEGS